jgi:ferrous iron transport protein A
MTNILDRKDMSVVLVVCSPACNEARSTTAADQTVEAVSTAQTVPLTSPSVATSSGDSQAGPIHEPPQGHQVTTPSPHHELNHIASDILTRGGYGSVEVGYCRDGYPSVEEAIERAVTHGTRKVVIVPMFILVVHPSPCEHLTGTSTNSLRQRIDEVRARHPGTSIVYASPPFDHERLVDLILCKIREYEPAALKAGVAQLNDLATGETAVVRELDGGAHFRSRMASLGFTPGALVKMVQNYGHGAVIVSLRGTRVALGRGEAHKVGVTRRIAQGQPGF